MTPVRFSTYRRFTLASHGSRSRRARRYSRARLRAAAAPCDLSEKYFTHRMPARFAATTKPWKWLCSYRRISGPAGFTGLPTPLLLQAYRDQLLRAASHDRAGPRQVQIAFDGCQLPPPQSDEIVVNGTIIGWVMGRQPVPQPLHEIEQTACPVGKRRFRVKTPTGKTRGASWRAAASPSTSLARKEARMGWIASLEELLCLLPLRVIQCVDLQAPSLGRPKPGVPPEQMGCFLEGQFATQEATISLDHARRLVCHPLTSPIPRISFEGGGTLGLSPSHAHDTPLKLRGSQQPCTLTRAPLAPHNRSAISIFAGCSESVGR
jgi:hypothetical protein